MKSALRRQVRNGNVQALGDALGQQQISHTEARAIVKESQQPPIVAELQHLDVEDALKVWNAASPEEKQAIRIPLIKKFTALKGSATPARLNALAAQYRLAGIFQ